MPEPDLTDLAVLVPKARRKIEGPFGLPNGRTLLDSQIYAMVGDAIGEMIAIAGEWFKHTLKVKKRDPLVGFATEWQTDTPLTEEEAAIVIAQVALDFYFSLFRDMKVSETIQNEGTQWTWEVSANLLKSYLQSVIEERDKAIGGLKDKIVFDRYSSNIRVRDQQTVALIEWWATAYDHLVPAGLPGGQEAAVVPVFFGTDGEWHP